MAKRTTSKDTCERSAFEEILHWGNNLAAWQQEALGRLIAEKNIDEAGRQQLLRFCKLEHGLDVEKITAGPRKLREFQFPTTADTKRSVQLLSVQNPQNINALCPEQELTFAAEGLTIVFGYNASGKSGYGRILRNVCRGRQKPPELKSNVLVQAATPKQSVGFKFLTNGVENEQAWDVKSIAPSDLACISIFDSECASVHVTQKNTLAFYPTGLEVLPALVEVMKDIQDRLKKEKSVYEEQAPRFLTDGTFSPQTLVGTEIRKLKPKTDTTVLEELAGLNNSELAELSKLQLDLSQDPRQVAEKTSRMAGYLRDLANALHQAITALGDAGIEQIERLHSELIVKREAAAAAVMLHDSGKFLPGLGSDAWQELWKAARGYSGIAYPDREYPVAEEDSKCLLCQQPLSPEARGRIKGFEAFVQDKTQQECDKAKTTFEQCLAAIDALKLWNDKLKALRRSLRADDPELYTALKDVWIILLLRKRQVTRRSFPVRNEWPVAKNSTVEHSLITKAAQLDEKAAAIGREASSPERLALQNQLQQLKDREFLAKVLGDIKEHIERLDVIAKLDECIDATNPRSITVKASELTKRFAEGRLRDAFASEIKNIGSRLRRFNVEMAEAGSSRGEKYYEVRFVSASKAGLAGVVSEGEHRCIALAGFLAELSTEEGKSGIVFDDPVTSLDHLWREAFANRIVEEARSRQVVVFTHDVVFLHDLVAASDQHDVALTYRGLRSVTERTGIVSTEPPWSLQGSLERLDSLRKTIKAKLIPLFAAGDDDQYSKAVRDFYDEYRSILEQSIEDIVCCKCVMRYRNEVKTQWLTTISVFTASDGEELSRLHKRSCDYVTAHHRSPYRGITVPDPDELKKDADDLAHRLNDLRLRQKSQRNGQTGTATP